MRIPGVAILRRPAQRPFAGWGNQNPKNWVRRTAPGNLPGLEGVKGRDRKRLERLELAAGSFLAPWHKVATTRFPVTPFEASILLRTARHATQQIQTDNQLQSWEQTFARFLHILGLDGVKRKILVFALLATLVPSLTIAWISDTQNSKLITEKVSEELRVSSLQTAREVDIWVKQRIYDLRVFSSSYEVSENLQKSAHRTTSTEALERLKSYLTSVKEKFSDYEELVVTDPEGRVVTTSAAEPGPIKLPGNWQQSARKGEPILGDAFWDDLTNESAVTIAVPIKSPDDRLLGLVAARLNFHTVEKLMQRLAHRESGQMYLIDSRKGVITTSQGMSPAMKDARLPDVVMRALANDNDSIVRYSDLKGESVLGSMSVASQEPWGSLAEISTAEAYAQTIKMRNLTIMITLVVLLVVGAGAYLLGATIVRPLNRLIKGANQVAEGDLNVEVPPVGGGEVGYLTDVFNKMVAKLRRSQEDLAAVNNTLTMTNRELQELSTTDPLTGLYNRRYMIDTLAKELSRAERAKDCCSVLILDIDHFKNYNDTYGHMAGDDLLIKAGTLFVRSIRNIDFAARYGGEEFLIVLPGQDVEGAVEVAERIRKEISAETSNTDDSHELVTVSIGVAAYPDNGTTVTDLIESADAALYQAKEGGRNRVVFSDVKAGEHADEDKQSFREKRLSRA